MSQTFKSGEVTETDAHLAPAAQRWLRMGPWYAMFPLSFALDMVREHTQPGDAVLDPFMGRGTTLAAAAALGRRAAGIEINPIAWLYAKTKLEPAEQLLVLRRLAELENLAQAIEAVPESEFFAWAFCPGVLRFLQAARLHLNWQHSQVDRTLMAFILVDLHGKDSASLSNQMRQTKSMAPDYAVRWWKAQNLNPRTKEAGQILRLKIAWRYRHGCPVTHVKTAALLGDSSRDADQVAHVGPFKLLLTSPPYCGIVNYNYDQWIRRWLLGGPEHPTTSNGEWQNRFGNKVEYRRLLTEVFTSVAPSLATDARVLVRTDARQFTLEATLDVLSKVFPRKQLQQNHRPFIGKTQTELFGDKAKKPGEVDILLS